MALMDKFLEILRAPTMAEMVAEMLVFLAPVWIAFLVGIFVGRVWKPRWVKLRDCKSDFSKPSLVSGDTVTSSSPVIDSDASSSRAPAPPFSSPANSVDKDEITLASVENPISSSLQVKKNESLAVNDDDLEHLHRLVERKDGGPQWKLMMERSSGDMSYQAWQRDPETGPLQYCSRTVYEDTTPELLRDFFWDDEFRLKWDDMLLLAKTLEECPSTGNMLVRWIRKFPFFCSDREYIIGRRIWESGSSYYCVTKGVPCDSVPRQEKPRRVDLYYSSWYIGADPLYAPHSAYLLRHHIKKQLPKSSVLDVVVASKKNDGEVNACEVILFHHEDMGIPWEIAKFGVRQGMWGAVKKIACGIQMYKKERSSGAPLSHTASMAQISTKINPDNLKYLENGEDLVRETHVNDDDDDASKKGRGGGINIPKLVMIGGVVAVACTFDKGLLTKTIIFSVARRFANLGRKTCPSRT